MNEIDVLIISLAIIVLIVLAICYRTILGVVVVISTSICTVMTVYNIFTFNLMLALNWFLIGLVVFIVAAIVTHLKDSK